MTQISHQPLSFGQPLADPRCPPTVPLSSSPILRQHIVHMIKTSSNPNGDKEQKKPIIRKSASSPSEQKENKKPESLDVNKTSVLGIRREHTNKFSDHKLGPLEKQTQSRFPSGGIRRLPFRPQQQNSKLHGRENDNANLNVSSSSKESSSNNSNSCEVKGNAINNTTHYVGTEKKRAEIHKKTQKFSASLNEFKRRLMMNQKKFYPSPDSRVEQYKVDNNKSNSSVQPHPPVTPRAALTRLSLTHGREPLPYPEVPEAMEVSPKPSYRLPSREAPKQIHPVETYVLVQNQRERIRGRFDEPIALTMHNLSMHNMFLEMDDRKKKDGGKVAAMARIQKWVENVHTARIRPSRSVRFNLSTTSSSADDSDSAMSS